MIRKRKRRMIVDDDDDEEDGMSMNEIGQRFGFPDEGGPRAPHWKLKMPRLDISNVSYILIYTSKNFDKI